MKETNTKSFLRPAFKSSVQWMRLLTQGSIKLRRDRIGEEYGIHHSLGGNYMVFRDTESRDGVQRGSSCTRGRLSTQIYRLESSPSLALPENLHHLDADLEWLPRLSHQTLDGRPEKRELSWNIRMGGEGKRAVLRGVALKSPTKIIHERICMVQT